MITPETLLDRTISQYENNYNLHDSVPAKQIKETSLIDAIAWVNKQLFDRALLSKEEYKNILAMIHSKDKENLLVAESIIRNLKFKL